MARIRHLAILSGDQAKLASFYKQTFGMKEIHRHPVQGDPGEAIYLSDGELNLAILPLRGRPEGIHHLGFQVESVPETAAVAAELGAAKAPEAVPRDGRFAEVFIIDPSGTRIDLSETGWKV
jgi:catechol 2,3-dioxygenase-like lactoylglutathione lyase family enzyme